MVLSVIASISMYANAGQLGNISPPLCSSSLRRITGKPSRPLNARVNSYAGCSIGAYTHRSTRWNRSTYLPTYQRRNRSRNVRLTGRGSNDFHWRGFQRPNGCFNLRNCKRLEIIQARGELCHLAAQLVRIPVITD